MVHLSRLAAVVVVVVVAVVTAIGAPAAAAAAESEPVPAPAPELTQVYLSQKHTQTHALDNTTTTKTVYTAAGLAAATPTTAGTTAYRA